jgi:parvulin-like peptidyl-prolyl isomerase
MNNSSQNQNSTHRNKWYHYLLKNRLLHFLIGGSIIFSLAPPTPVVQPQITISSQMAESLVNRASRQPSTLTNSDKNRILDNFIRDELLFREGIHLGLDKGDQIIQNRVIQKVKYLLQNQAEAAVENQKTLLEAWYLQHREKWKTPIRLSFKQIFVSNTTPQAEQLAKKFYQDLITNPALNIAKMGTRAVFPKKMRGASYSNVKSRFGTAFADTVFTLPANHRWNPPFSTKKGWHLVRISTKQGGEVPPLAKIKHKVALSLRQYLQKRNIDKRVIELAGNYKIIVNTSWAYYSSLFSNVSTVKTP